MHGMRAEDATSSCLPSDSADPTCPCDNVFSLQQSFHRPKFTGQLLITGDPMNEAMAGSTQPSYTVKAPLIVPATLNGFGMHLSGDQVVVAQRDPVPFTNFAR